MQKYYSALQILPSPRVSFIAFYIFWQLKLYTLCEKDSNTKKDLAAANLNKMKRLALITIFIRHHDDSDLSFQLQAFNHTTGTLLLLQLLSLLPQQIYCGESQSTHMMTDKLAPHPTPPPTPGGTLQQETHWVSNYQNNGSVES